MARLSSNRRSCLVFGRYLRSLYASVCLGGTVSPDRQGTRPTGNRRLMTRSLCVIPQSRRVISIQASASALKRCSPGLTYLGVAGGGLQRAETWSLEFPPYLARRPLDFGGELMSALGASYSFISVEFLHLASCRGLEKTLWFVPAHHHRRGVTELPAWLA